MNSAMNSYLDYNGHLFRMKHGAHYHSILPWLTCPDDTGWNTSTFQAGIPPCSPAWASLRFTEAFSSSHFLCPIGPTPQKGPICSAKKFRFLESASSVQVRCGGVCLPDASLHLFRDPHLRKQGPSSEDSSASRVGASNWLPATTPTWTLTLPSTSCDLSSPDQNL